ncbi:hypothetical protein I4U23_029338 [Adineta vaga]|nr:hypothetical protein I4U23_029338 [Adineta vaga]
MSRVQSLEFNQNSNFFQSTKKVSLPTTNESVRRSTSKTNDRSTIVPLTIVQNNIPNYFGSTMQSMCFAFFTFAYTELINGAVFLGNSLLIHVFLKFITILCISLATLAAFSSLRVSLSIAENNLKLANSDVSKFYSTIARFGSIFSAITCAIIICIFAIVSLYVTFNGKENS